MSFGRMNVSLKETSDTNRHQLYHRCTVKFYGRIHLGGEYITDVLMLSYASFRHSRTYKFEFTNLNIDNSQQYPRTFISIV